MTILPYFYEICALCKSCFSLLNSIFKIWISALINAQLIFGGERIQFSCPRHINNGTLDGWEENISNLGTHQYAKTSIIIQNK